jgi:3-hydroxyisobutyrate dehydrogenase
MRVALLGTGTMGAGMARNLVKAGHDVRVWNRTPERAQGLGATVAGTPAEAVEGAEVVITMLADGPAVEAVAAGLDLGDAVWAQMSTIAIDETERLARGTFVDAPVLGSKPQAESGELTIFASGPFERCRPVFEAVGRIVDLGPEPGAGTRMKLVLNHWVLALTESVAETVLFAERVGIDPKRFLEVIDGSPMGPPYAQLKGGYMVERSYPPNFSLKLARKDAELIASVAGDLPLAGLISERMAAVIAAGRGDEDFAAVVEAGRA